MQDWREWEEAMEVFWEKYEEELRVGVSIQGKL